MITLVAGAKTVRWILCVSVWAASLGVCSACAVDGSNVPVTHECCPHRHDHRLPASPAQKECQNSCVENAPAERPEAGSLVKRAIQQEMITSPSADVPPPIPWDNTRVFKSSLVRICQLPSSSVLLI